MQTKVCSKCREEKELSAFCKDNRNKSGISNRCRECSKKYRKENAEKEREYRKKYRKENAEKIREIQKKYRKENAEELKEYQNKWYKENAEELKEYRKKYRKENAEELSDVYICSILKTRISNTPRSLIESKRLQIKIHRLINNKPD